MSDRLVIKDTKGTIYLEEFDLEFQEDFIGLALDFSMKHGVSFKDENITVLATAASEFLNDRWKEHLGEKTLGLADALKCIKPIMEKARELKKNMSEDVK